MLDPEKIERIREECRRMDKFWALVRSDLGAAKAALKGK